MGLIETFARPDLASLRGSVRRVYRELYNWEVDFPISLQASTPNGKSIFRLEFALDDDEVTDFWNEIKSTLNGTLPIELRIGKSEEPSFRVMKRGPGGPALSAKADKIARFLGSRIDFSYIPAIRTAEAASDVVLRMVARKLVALEDEPAYQEAIAKIQELQEPLLLELSKEVTDTLKEFLTDVRDVTVTIPERARYRSFRRDCEIIVDDGTPTLLERKGDGVKSLAAIGLLFGATPTKAASVLALEEPESHLHPKAIHTLKTILNDLSNRTQLVITTHNPLFVDRVTIRNNILVSDQSAKPARNISEIRQLLGVRASDNLSHARLVLIVEGPGDKTALESIFRQCSEALAVSLDGGDLVIDHLGGAAKLSYKLSLLQAALCNGHVFLDHDSAGQSACETAIKDGLVTDFSCQYSTCVGMKESELEDCFSVDAYKHDLHKEFGVDLDCKEFRNTKKKWSDRVGQTFVAQGRTWNAGVKARVKACVANVVAKNLASALITPKRAAIDALINALEQRFNSLS